MRLLRHTRVLGSHLTGVSSASCIGHCKARQGGWSGAEKIEYSIRREPAIPTPAGIQRLDLVLVRNSDLTILDVTMVADNADHKKTHNDKCVYYDVPGIRQWTQLCFEPRHIAFEALAMNWRGLLATRSATALWRLGLSVLFLSLVLAVALEHATWIVNHFRRLTYTNRSRWWHLICAWCSPESRHSDSSGPVGLMRHESKGNKARRKLYGEVARRLCRCRVGGWSGLSRKSVVPFTVQSHMLSLKLNSEVTDISVKSQMLTFIQFVSPITSCVESAFLLVKDVRTLMPWPP